MRYTLRKQAKALPISIVIVLGIRAPVLAAEDASPIFNFDFEDDVVSGTDRYYTTGIRLGLSWSDAVEDIIFRKDYLLDRLGEQ